jgi:multicomponent Na+:H+ antiporter subunit F
VSGIFAATAVGLLLFSVPYLARVLAGPTVFDRVVALNGLGTKVPVLIILVGLVYGRAELLLDLALGLFLLNLVTTLLIARHVREKGSV